MIINTFVVFAPKTNDDISLTDNNEEDESEPQGRSFTSSACGMGRVRDTKSAESDHGGPIEVGRKNTWWNDFVTCRSCGQNDFHRHHNSNDGLYRVQSCPGIIGSQDWFTLHQQQLVPESPPEPISDSVLLKMRSCRNRQLHQSSFERSLIFPNPRPIDFRSLLGEGKSAHLDAKFASGAKTGSSFGSLECEQLWCKLQNVHEDTKAESSHSSSSTLASSSFSIAVQ